MKHEVGGGHGNLGGGRQDPPPGWSSARPSPLPRISSCCPWLSPVGGPMCRGEFGGSGTGRGGRRLFWAESALSSEGDSLIHPRALTHTRRIPGSVEIQK